MSWCMWATHGNMEFLPGKSVALSESCFPDIVVGDIPYLYIYNSDNPPEGAVAKRRSYAVIVDHMQTTMTQSGLYGDLKELEDNIAAYNQSKVSEKGRAHALEHVILDLLKKTNLSEEMKLENLIDSGTSFEKILEKAHGRSLRYILPRFRMACISLERFPKERNAWYLINAILRFDSETRKFLSGLMDRAVTEKEQDPLARNSYAHS